MCRSVPQSPTAATRSSTSRGPSWGVGTFRTARARTSWSTQARIVLKSGLLPPPVVLGKSQCICRDAFRPRQTSRSEEHTSELQSLTNLVCRLLLEKKKKKKKKKKHSTDHNNN